MSLNASGWVKIAAMALALSTLAAPSTGRAAFLDLVPEGGVTSLKAGETVTYDVVYTADTPAPELSTLDFVATYDSTRFKATAPVLNSSLSGAGLAGGSTVHPDGGYVQYSGGAGDFTPTGRTILLSFSLTALADQKSATTAVTIRDQISDLGGNVLATTDLDDYDNVAPIPLTLGSANLAYVGSAAVPEPSSAVLLLAGGAFVGLGVRRVRRRRAVEA